MSFSIFLKKIIFNFNFLQCYIFIMDNSRLFPFIKIGKEIISSQNKSSYTEAKQNDKSIYYPAKTCFEFDGSNNKKVSFTNTILSKFPQFKLPLTNIIQKDKFITKSKFEKSFSNDTDDKSNLSLRKVVKKTLKNGKISNSRYDLKKIKTFDELTKNHIVNIMNIKFDFSINTNNHYNDKDSNNSDYSGFIDNLETNSPSLTPQCKKSRNNKIFLKSHSERCHHSFPFGFFSGFSAVTFKNFKKNNEDKLRISIDTRKVNQNNLINFFGIYDGHRGDYTSKYLKDNFHSILLNDNILSTDPIKALENTFTTIETNLLTQKEKSGSCSLILFNINNKIYIANVGDSRGVVSTNYSNKISEISIDHKPTHPIEIERILKNGGQVKTANAVTRVMPYGLSVSRTIGDSEAKEINSQIISGQPDIFEIREIDSIDFIVLACDGIYDVLSNRDIAIIVYETFLDCILTNDSFDTLIEDISDNIIDKAIEKGSKDNLSVIFLCFPKNETLFKEKNVKKIKAILTQLKLSINSKNEDCELSDLIVNKNEFDANNRNSNIEKNNDKFSIVNNSESNYKNNTTNNITNNSENKKGIIKKDSSLKENFFCCFCFGKSGK